MPSFYSLALHHQPHLSALRYLFGILKGSLSHESWIKPSNPYQNPFCSLKRLKSFLFFKPKMRRKRLPIFHKVSNLLRIFVAKMRKPTIPKLILIKKSRKRRRFKLLKHYNGFLEEYEFSPLSTSLAHHPKKQFKFRSYKDNIYTMLFLCRCLGGLKADQGGEGRYRLSMDSTLPVATISTGDFLEPLDYLVDEEDSVDQRAERFIERFYQDMRMQRQESI